MKKRLTVQSLPAVGTNEFRKVGPLLVLAIVVAAQSARAQIATQTFTLQPGWNSIYLEVQPTNNRTAAVFSNLPAASVWTRAERLSSVDFIQDPSEQAFNEAGWLRWFHPSRPEAFLGNLFTVQANRAYLIKLTNTVPINWSVVGRPSLRRPEWVPDSYNLRGFPVDPALPPTFLSFLRHSKAHYDSTASQLQKIYRLNSATGQWQLIAPTDLVQNGAAYWIYTSGASDYLAPVSAEVEIGDGLDFGDTQTELSLRLKNLTVLTANVSLRDLSSPTGILSLYQFNSAVGVQWFALPNPLSVTVAGKLGTRLRLAARRQDLSGNSYASILEVRDGAGTRLWVPVLVEKFTNALSAAQIAAAGKIGGAGIPDPDPLAGLWVGTATINAVSEAHSANPTNPTPAKSELNLRLMLHTDANGQTRLLKEVIQMWRNGTFTNDSNGNRVVEKPGEYVLLTDDTLIPMFSGAALRDGQSVGRRLSTIGYDFPSSATNNFLNMAGTFAIGGSLTATLVLPHDHPTNPFKHKYHPDHDNLDAHFDEPVTESFTTRRQIELTPSASPPDGPSAPDYGYNVIGGAYRETITGIHKRSIHLRGTFRLSRVSLIAELNPNPQP